MRAGGDILRAGSANANSTELEDLIIFRRDDKGLLREQIYAKSSKLAEGRWTLSDVVIYRDNLQPSRLDTLVYSGSMKPAQAGARSGAPEDMSLADLSYFIENQGFGIRPVWVYQTWVHKRVSLFFSGLLMIALCIPLATRFRRGGGLGALFAIGVGVGFPVLHRRWCLAHDGRAWLRVAMDGGLAAFGGFRFACCRIDAPRRECLSDRIKPHDRGNLLVANFRYDPPLQKST